MSRKLKPGGSVQIRRTLYDVIEGPARHGVVYRIMVRSRDHNGAYWAESPHWRSGCGPWHITGPVVSEE